MLEADIIFTDHRIRRAIAGATLLLFSAGTTLAGANTLPISSIGDGSQTTYIPTGQLVTPLAAPGATYERLRTGLRPDGNADADSAMTSVASPDGKTMLVLTSGFNTGFNYQKTQSVDNPAAILFPQLDPTTGKPTVSVNQAEFVFVYDISSGKPKRLQQIAIPDTFDGLVWDPQGGRFYVSGGNDDRILVYKASSSGYVPDAPFIVLNHDTNGSAPFPNYDGGILSGTRAGKAAPQLVTGAVVAGLDISKDGKTIVAANYENASVTIVNAVSRAVTGEVKFTPPGSPVPVGEFPFWVSIKSEPGTGAYAKAYVSSVRDDQVVVVSGTSVRHVIPVPSGPNKMAIDAAQHFLYVACGNDDSVAVIDTTTDTLVRTIALRPGNPLKGSNPNSIAIAPNGLQLYVTLGGENAVAVVDIARGTVAGRIPAGWYPTSVTTDASGANLFVVNEKSNEGPDPGQTYYSHNTPYGISLNTTGTNLYTWEGEKSGVVAMPVPSAATLASLTSRVDANNGVHNAGNEALFATLRTKIKHVIYIVNENRTFDQVLGDLHNGSNGDPRLTFFTQPITPNLHALAADYVTLDNFYDAGETSGVGWNWVMQGHTNDFVEKTQPVNYGNGGNGGLTYDWQGVVQHMNLGLPPVNGTNSLFSERVTGVLDPSGSSTILPGTRDPAASAGALQDVRPGGNAYGGYIWESVIRAGGTVRNYGWQVDLSYYGTKFGPAPVRNPFNSNTLQASPSTPTIRPLTDPFYRAFDMNYPDIYRIEEWKRDYAYLIKTNHVPTLMTMTIPHDHTGGHYATNLEGLSSPQLELADHDYAVGQLVEAVSHGPYWNSTAIIMVEDDPQNGQDHVEAHRSIAHIISPYTKRKSVVSTFYTSVNALRTVEELAGARPLGLNDANAVPMADVFTTTANAAVYNAIVPGSLCAPPVAKDLVPACSNPAVRKTARVAQLHDGAWWGRMTAGLDFSGPDRVDTPYYNALLEFGITGHGTVPKKPARMTTSDRSDD